MAGTPAAEAEAELRVLYGPEVKAERRLLSRAAAAEVAALTKLLPLVLAAMLAAPPAPPGLLDRQPRHLKSVEAGAAARDIRQVGLAVPLEIPARRVREEAIMPQVAAPAAAAIQLRATAATQITLPERAWAELEVP